jgi:uncharacterized membrane protein YdjX (TVP38/TMEM64 family)
VERVVLALPVEADAGGSPARALARAIGLAVLLLAAGVALRETGPGLLHDVRPTPSGAALLVVAGGALTAAGLPRQAVAFAGGYAFGALPGGLLSLLAQMLGCLVDYLAARTIAGGWAARRLASLGPGRLARTRRLLDAHPFTATLTLRLLPVGSNLLLNLVAGVAAVRAGAFLGGTLLGYLPQTAIFSLLGSGVQVGRGTELALGAGLFVASGLLGVVLVRRV